MKLALTTTILVLIVAASTEYTGKISSQQLGTESCRQNYEICIDQEISSSWLAQWYVRASTVKRCRHLPRRQ